MDQLGVVGAGTMGHGIAHVAALAGFRVVLCDVSRDAADAGVARIRANLAKGVDRGKVTSSQAAEAQSRLRADVGPGPASRGSSVIIEAVPEKMALKQALLRDIEAEADDDAIIGSNTSSLSLTELQNGLRCPARVIGMHFFNPVHIMALLEIVRGDETSDDVVERTQSLARRLGKEPIVVRDTPGFATSRLGIALGNEAMRMFEEGVASAEDIDKAMTLGYRHPMGPLRLTDLVGLDVRLAISRYLHEKLGSDTFRPPGILEQLVENGHLGKKTGRGFYTYSE